MYKSIFVLDFTDGQGNDCTVNITNIVEALAVGLTFQNISVEGFSVSGRECGMLFNLCHFALDGMYVSYSTVW